MQDQFIQGPLSLLVVEETSRHRLEHTFIMNKLRSTNTITVFRREKRIEINLTSQKTNH
jgi:hypothetical protein